MDFFITCDQIRSPQLLKKSLTESFIFLAAVALVIILDFNSILLSTNVLLFQKNQILTVLCDFLFIKYTRDVLRTHNHLQNIWD